MHLRHKNKKILSLRQRLEMSDIDTNGSGKSRLLMRRVRAEYLVSSEHPAPLELKSRIDEAIARELTTTMAAGAAPLMPEHDSNVWLIRRLDVQADLNVAWERNQIARAIAAQIIRELALAMRGGRHEGDALCFPTRAAYLARFLADLTAGNAWGKWYYEEFDGLRLLPVSAAMRTAICEHPLLGQRALLDLSPDELPRTLRALTAQDARRILETMAAHGTVGDEWRCLQLVWSVWTRSDRAMPVVADDWQTALLFYLNAMRENPAANGAALKSAVLAMLCLSRHCRNDETEQTRRLIAAITVGDTAALFTIAGAADAERLAPLFRCPPQWVEGAASEMQGSRHSAEPAGAKEEPRYTSFGGMFLLLPLLSEMPLVEAVRDWPAAEEAAAISLVRFLLLVKCFGRERAERASADPLLRDLLLIPPSLSAASIADWSANISAAQFQQFLTVLAEWRHERESAFDLSQAEQPAHTERLKDDLAYLSLPRRLGVSRALDRALSVAAQGLLRNFAHRLAGFAESHLPYLFRNFLDFPARLDDEPARRVVRLGRPPLHLILNVTGMPRRTYQLPWLDERPLALFQEE